MHVEIFWKFIPFFFTAWLSRRQQNRRFPTLSQLCVQQISRLLDSHRLQPTFLGFLMDAYFLFHRMIRKFCIHGLISSIICVSLVSTTTIHPDGKQLPIQSKVRAFVVWQSTLCLVPYKYHYDTTTGCHLQCLEAITQVNGGSAHAFPPLVCCYVSSCRILTFMLASEKTYGTNIRQGYATFWLFRL